VLEGIEALGLVFLRQEQDLRLVDCLKLQILVLKSMGLLTNFFQFFSQEDRVLGVLDHLYV
jgi:hypothetical protein